MGEGNKITKLLKSFDNFGVQMKLRINKEKNFTSLSGGISSLIFFTFSTIYVLYNLTYFINRENASYVFSNKVVTGPLINFTDTDFRVAFSVINCQSYETVIDDVKDYIDFSMKIDTWDVMDQIRTDVPLHLCTYKDFDVLSEEAFDNNGLESYLCPDFTNLNVPLLIAGTNSDDYYQGMEFYITLKESVKDFSYLQEYIQENTMCGILGFINKGVLYDNLNNPLPSFLNNYYLTLDFNLITESEFFISNLAFSSDENWITQDEKNYKGYVLDYVKDWYSVAGDRSIFPEHRKILNRFIIRAGEKSFKVNRKYQKIPEFLANMSGLLSKALIIIFIIFNFTNTKGAEQKLMNKTLNLNGNKNSRLDNLMEGLSKIYKEEKIKKDTQPDIKPNEDSSLEMKKNNTVAFVPSIKKETSSFEKSYSVPSQFSLNDLKLHPIPIDKNVPQYDNYSEDNFKLELENKTNFIPTRRNSKIILSPYPNQNKIPVSNTRIFKMNFMEILFTTICCCCTFWKKKSEILTQAEKKIYFNMDVLTYVRKMQEIDILKYLLLSKDQLRLFKFLSKPALSSSHLHKDLLEEEKLYFSFSKDEVEKVCESYKNLLLKEDLDEREKKLLELFEEEVNNLNSSLI